MHIMRTLLLACPWQSVSWLVRVSGALYPIAKILQFFRSSFYSFWWQMIEPCVGGQNRLTTRREAGKELNFGDCPESNRQDWMCIISQYSFSWQPGYHWLFRRERLLHGCGLNWWRQCPALFTDGSSPWTLTWAVAETAEDNFITHYGSALIATEWLPLDCLIGLGWTGLFACLPAMVDWLIVRLLDYLPPRAMNQSVALFLGVLLLSGVCFLLVSYSCVWNSGLAGDSRFCSPSWVAWSVARESSDDEDEEGLSQFQSGSDVPLPGDQARGNRSLSHSHSLAPSSATATAVAPSSAPTPGAVDAALRDYHLFDDFTITPAACSPDTTPFLLLILFSRPDAFARRKVDWSRMQHSKH